MYFLPKFIVFSALVATLGACSSFKFPGVYRIPIQQGNYVEEEMISQLKVGQDKRQVRFILGTPMIQDTFNPDRWDYHYSLSRGDKQLRENHFTVFFKDEKLTHWEGNYIPIKKEVEEEQREALEKTEKKENAKF